MITIRENKRNVFAALVVVASQLFFLGGICLAQEKDLSKGGGEFMGMAASESISDPSCGEGLLPGVLVLTLEDCIQIAVAHSKDIKLAAERIGLAKLRKTAAFRDLFPSLSFYWNETKGDDSQMAAYRGKQYGGDLEQEIWPRDVTYYTYLQSDRNVKFNETDYKKVNRDLLYEVKKAFYELARAKNELKDQSEIIGKAKDLFELVEKEQAKGLISKLEYLKSLAKYKEVENQSEVKGYLLKLATANLRNVLRIDAPSFLIDIDSGNLFEGESMDFLLGAVNEEKALDDYIDIALSNRLEMKLQKTKAEFYKYGDKAVRGKGLPKLSFIGSYKKVGDAFDPDTIDYDNEWFVGGKVTFPWLGNVLEYSYQTGVSVPNRSSTYSTVNESDVRNQSVKLSVLNNLTYYYDRKEAEIAYQTSLKDEEEQARKIIMEVKEAFYSYRNAVSKSAAAAERLKFALKEEEVVEFMVKSAEETISKAMEVLFELQETRGSYMQALFEYYVSALDLNRATEQDLIHLP